MASPNFKQLSFKGLEKKFNCGLALFYAEMNVCFESLSTGERTLLVFEFGLDIHELVPSSHA